MDLTRNPPHGITCWPKNDRNDQLEASKLGKRTPFLQTLMTLYLKQSSKAVLKLRMRMVVSDWTLPYLRGIQVN